MPFSDIHISQCSVATRLGCGGVFIYHFVTNFLLRQEFDVLFFLTHGVCSLYLILKIFISPEWTYPVAKQTENNKITNLTIDINSQYIQHDEVGNTWNYTEQNNLWHASGLRPLPLMLKWISPELSWTGVMEFADWTPVYINGPVGMHVFRTKRPN